MLYFYVWQVTLVYIMRFPNGFMISNITKHVQLLLGAVCLVAVASALFIYSPASARESASYGPPDCSSTQPQNCAMTRAVYESISNAWCSMASSGKEEPKVDGSPLIRDICKWSFAVDFVWSKNSDIRSKANFANPPYCDSPPEDRKQDAKEYCYVLFKKNTAFYNAQTKIVEECGIGTSQDAKCARDAKLEFLRAQKTGKGVPWLQAATPTNSDKNFNPDEYAPDQSPFMIRVATYIRWATVGIGLLAVFGVVISGIQYAAAQDNPQSLAAAKGRITNIVIGIIIYFLMFGALQWLIPGGVF